MFGKALRRRRVSSLVIALLVFGLFQFINQISSSRSIPSSEPQPSQSDVLAELDSVGTQQTVLALQALDTLDTKGRAAKTGYSRDNFSDGWAQIGSCDVRNLVLQRDFDSVEIGSDGCTVLSGQLDDPYTGQQVAFVRGPDSSDDVQVDHVVALSDAWQKGAQQLDAQERFNLYNDSLNLLAVEGSANQQKGDSDAATWLPSNKSYRCRYVARQIAVKQKYRLWVTEAERSAMNRILQSCVDQPLPLVGDVSTSQ